jgi:hypothetical protein
MTSLPLAGGSEDSAHGKTCRLLPVENLGRSGSFVFSNRQDLYASNRNLGENYRPPSNNG